LENNRTVFHNKRSVKNGRFTKFFLKKSSKKDVIAHQNQIFDIYQTWIDTPFVIDVDLENFDLDHMYINLTRQIELIESRDNNSTTLWSNAISHLMSGYPNVYKKYDDIKTIETKFNDYMNDFLELHRKRLTNLLASDNFTPKGELIDKLFRYMLSKSQNHNENPNVIAWKLESMEPFIQFDREYNEVRIYNPFPERVNDLISYHKKYHENFIEAINQFYKSIKNLSEEIRQFREQLTIIMHNKIKGLKGECDFEINIS
jgi:hypothetical protein